MISSVEFDGPGLPLRLVTRSEPGLSEGEALVRIRLCTLCGSDLHTYFGRRSTPVPTVLGHEIVGEIEVNNGMVDVRGVVLNSGDRVVWSVARSCRGCFYCERELPQKCETLRKYGHLRVDETHAALGGLSTHCYLLAGTDVIRVPDGLPDAVAAPAMCASATVAAAQRAAGPVESLVVIGAGLLGLNALAMSQAGIKIVVDPQPERIALAKLFGASHSAASLADIRAVTDGRGADAVFELSGQPAAVELALAAARIGGSVVLVGSVFPSKPIPLAAEDVVRRCLKIVGVHNYSPVDLSTAINFLAGNHTRYPFAECVEKYFPLADVGEAFEYAERHKPIRVGVTPA